MTLCPVCNAQLEELRECRRCKTDLGQIMDIRTEALLHKEKATVAFEQSRFHDMFFHARRSFTLYSSTEAAKLFACASVMINKFDLGYDLWKKLQQQEERPPLQ
ncbi:MAG: hypothetical protein HQK61_05470 [Desulfamplus sp.]|nr:hypothetical protein [Desulfamplus sp.]